MIVIFTGRGAFLLKIVCVVLLPFSVFVGIVLFFSGVKWGISIIVIVTVLLCLHSPISDRMAYAAALDGGGLPVQQQQPVPEMTAPPHAEPMPQRDGGVTRGMGASAIAALPAYAYEKKGGADDCSVCLGELQLGEAVKQLPACAHLFHDVCIDAWLRSHVTCPVCRSPVDVAALPAAAAEIVVRIHQ
ncbi:hypothetical protein PR202_ga15250 [Eleusine coracana subsp. coracana]|uniref:RING-type E3 ubiquitin transferase n=1 Tax=Eleusine coracana subsp. coracana TaxID=191504 RepID=A0AAV5CJK3_ELECO|nr:hypothetical protein QOZ80_6BG0495190 [Eleusine coracana subsp. coracana]GJM98260.1 hypothetical protein PR202_ga15250 [Eleusine coracana subsp. coracana]